MNASSCLFLLASGAGTPPIVTSIAVAFVAAAALALLCERLRLPSIAGFIFAGLVIGPIGLAFINDPEQIETIAGLGLVLLLFLIGLELDLRALLASGRTLIVTGMLQVPLSAAVGFGVFMGAAALGFGSTAVYPALYLGLACGFSSTLLVVKVLHDRLQIDTVDGRLCIGLLIFQDIWAIVVLALQPNLESFNVAPLIGTFLGVGVVIAVAWFGTRFLLPSAFRLVAKSPELVVTLALGWCFGLGMLANLLGPLADALGLPVHPSVSMELGALVAGTSIATFPYAHEVVAKVGNLRDFFITLFFVALGMSIPVPSGAGVLLAALALALVMFLIRYVVFLPLLYVTGLDRRHATTTSTKLAQVSEFALVIAYLGLSLGHIDGELVSIVIFAFVLTAILTPMLFKLADPLFSFLATPLGWLGIRDDREAKQAKVERAPRLVFLGFHRLASSLLQDLQTTHPEIIPDTLVVDFNVAIHDRIRARGPRVIYGDIANPASLHGSGVSGADVIICTISDDILKGITNLELTRQLRKIAPNAKILVNAVRLRDMAGIYAAGADYVFSWRTETAVGVVPALCAALNGSIDGFLEARQREFGDPVARDEVLD
ncbi:Glutathione-regulated potassium-efflux system protein KefB [Enhygromyxa salina]|uniref:Glutathione-regulated potassium-efflux system protein KefB n=1 Tax=Enhygromyxa salina TaxID=215803 RepID=A0A0C2DAG2_9BACT|nr:cation:proton antiporter [Enhygromyxa salina]KIG16877.1 Glutathione-regulated potassium-efflux system protein KefB [Enhygromyxa salina]